MGWYEWVSLESVCNVGATVFGYIGSGVFNVEARFIASIPTSVIVTIVAVIVCGYVGGRVRAANFLVRAEVIGSIATGIIDTGVEVLNGELVRGYVVTARVFGARVGGFYSAGTAWASARVTVHGSGRGRVVGAVIVVEAGVCGFIGTRLVCTIEGVSIARLCLRESRDGRCCRRSWSRWFRRYRGRQHRRWK